MRIGIVMGTRPEIIKNYSIVKALQSGKMDFHILHTNQHSDYTMHGSLFKELGYCPDIVSPGQYSFGKAIDWVRDTVKNLRLDLILVNGDTAAALAGAIAGLYSDIKVAHVEAGLRSHDPLMYEERNRIMVDTMAHYLFAYTRERAHYLKNNAEIRGRVFVAGNTTMDLIADFKDRLKPSSTSRYAYVTLHRKEFTDQHEVMVKVFETLNILASELDHIYFPVHPRTRSAIKTHGIPGWVLSNVTLMDPVSAIDSLNFISNAALVMTDSGCIQEEAFILKTPCLTIRNNTERSETLSDNANIVTGFDPSRIKAAAVYQLTRGNISFRDAYGPGGAGKRIVDSIISG